LDGVLGGILHRLLAIVGLGFVVRAVRQRGIGVVVTAGLGGFASAALGFFGSSGFGFVGVDFQECSSQRQWWATARDGACTHFSRTRLGK
jgi:hypothetical protein